MKPELSLVLRTSESLFFGWPKKSNQKKGHPSRPPAHILVRRSLAVLAPIRPPNNSAIPGLEQFGYPLIGAALLSGLLGAP